MTIHVKQHYRNVNGKLVLVKEHEHQGNAAQHVQPQRHEKAVDDEFDKLFADHGPEQAAAQEPDVDSEFDKLFGEQDVDSEFDKLFSEEDGQPEEQPEAKPEKKLSPPTAAELEGIGGKPWQEKGHDRIYFNGLHKLYLESDGPHKDVPFEQFKGAKLWFDKKDGQFKSKGLNDFYFDSLTKHLTKKAKEWGTQNTTFIADPASSSEDFSTGWSPWKDGDKVPAKSLKIGMKLKTTAGTPYTVVGADDEYVTLSHNGAEHSVVKDSYDDTTNLLYAGHEADEEDDSPKPGDEVNFQDLKPGMHFKMAKHSTSKSAWLILSKSGDSVTYEHTDNFGAKLTKSVKEDLWDSDFTPYLALVGTEKVQEAPKQQRVDDSPKIGGTVNYDQLDVGMVLKFGADGESVLVVDNDGSPIIVQAADGFLSEMSSKTWDHYKDKYSLVSKDGTGLPKKPLQSDLHVGDTKTINGVTYQLNANHRWEKVDGGKAATMDKLLALDAYSAGGTVSINGFAVMRSSEYMFRVMKSDENGKPLSKKMKDALAELHPEGYLKKKGYYIIRKESLDKLAAIIDGKPAAKPKVETKPKAAIPAVTTGGAADIRNWKKLSDAKGSNEGGLYEDETGKKFYVKFPASESVAKNEILASKLYQACGIDSPDVNAITHNGKVGVASEWKDGLKTGSPSALAKADGAMDGFVVDAWLANWDVVGLGYDNMLLDGNGKAVRIDPGGALLYRAQGELKPELGNTVTELHTLKDMAKNDKAASVFGAITHDQMVASATKLLEVSDDDIKTMVKAWGPGGMQDRDGLADKLIARKAYIAKMFPEALPKPKVNIKATPNFKEWNGPGKGLSGKAWINDQNQEIAEKIHDAGKAGDLHGLESMQFQPISYNDGTPEGPSQPISAHKSHWITDYWKEIIDKVKAPEITYKKIKADLLSNVKALAGKAHAIAAAFPDVKKLKECQKRIGRYGVMGAFHDNPMDGWAPKELSESNKGIDVQSIYDESQKAFAKLTSTQRQAIKAYTGSEYHSINNPNTGEGTSGMTDHAIKGLAEAAVPLPEGMVISRKFKFNKDHDNNHEALMQAANSVLKDYGCISTATRPDIWSGDYQLRITCAQGVKGLFVDKNPSTGGGAISNCAGEREIILPYGTKFLVRKIHHQPFKDEHGSWGHVGKSITIDVIALPNDEPEQ